MPIKSTPRVLIVEDEPAIAELISINLRHHGLSPLWVENGELAQREIDTVLPDLILLDWMLPGESGVMLARKWRSDPRTKGVPIIMLTAKGDDVDRIVGLEIGADDYLGKPFNPRELLARVNAVLRRRPAREAPGAPAPLGEKVVFGPFEFDLALRKLTRDGDAMALTTGEFSMLKALVRHPRQPLSRDKLAQLARGRDFEPFDRSLDVQISRLRKILEQDPAQPRFIQTVWGVGYVFVPDAAA